ncbi:SBBP repeat-containing protein [Candidatus Zixiibacteriota bacterium]
MVGDVLGADFPTTSGAFDTTYNGGVYDVFVVKLNSSGSFLEYATFIGGNQGDWGHGIAVDGSGHVFITGLTESTDFPVTAGAFDTTYNYQYDGYVAKLNQSGSALDFCTYLGGSDADFGIAIRTDSSGQVYIGGGTRSSNFPVTYGAYDTLLNGSRYDGFVAKLTTTGNVLEYATYLGGNLNDDIWSIEIDAAGSVYLTGETDSPNFPVTYGAFDTTKNDTTDAYVSKLSPGGDALIYSTFLGGTKRDYGWGIDVDDMGNAYVTGYTASSDFPTTPGAYDETHNGSWDGFVVRLDPDGATMIYATFLGTGGTESCRRIAVSDHGWACVGGGTSSPDFPTTDGAFDLTYNGGDDVFVVLIDPSGHRLDYASYLGGNDDDYCWHLVLDRHSNVYLSGTTLSGDFPVTADAFDTTYGGGFDVYVSKLNLSVPQEVADLTATLLEDDLRLDWSALTTDGFGNPLDVDQYYVYRDTTVYFEPGSEPFDSSVAVTYVDDSGVTGDTGTNYYYAVSAVSGGKESVMSPPVGEFDREVIAGE